MPEVSRPRPAGQRHARPIGHRPKAKAKAENAKVIFFQ